MNPIYKTFLEDFAHLAEEAKDFPLAKSRAVSTEFLTKNAVKEPVLSIEDLTISGKEGDAIPMRLFRPSSDPDLPVLLFFHGGGWSFGSLEEGDPLCRRIANLSNIAVIAVDYRLSPENKFPKGLEDCYAALKWVYEKSGEIGIDPSRIAVGGESAGANLAAALALMTRDKGEFLVKFQLLLYPAVTDDMSQKNFKDSLDQSFITKDALSFYLNFYLNTPEEGSHPYVSPLKAKDLSGLPPAFIITAEHDPLHTEGEAYMKRLKDFHVPVTGKRYTGAIHNFLSLPLPDLPDRIAALSDIRDQLAIWKNT